ncbi:iron complex outermembrane receptor protein [Bradyrhizobium sp. USDA 4341]
MYSSFGRRRQRLLSSVAAYPIALFGGAVALSTVAVYSPTRANDAEVEEVTITARDRTEKAQDVPLPISAVGGKAATTQHIEKIQDAVQHVPSLTPQVTNPRTSANGLRGITGISGGADGSEGDVGLIVDNVFYTYIGFSWLSYYDIDSLQVARGPQGTLLGKNTTTGAVIINTNPPSFTPQTTTETTFGSRKLAEEKLTTTGPLIPDKLAYRVSLFGVRQDGYLPNLYSPGPEGQDVNRWGARVQLLGTVENVTDRFIVEHLASAETNNATPTWLDGWTVNFDGSPRSISATNAAGKTATFQTPQAALAYLYPQYASRFVPQPYATVYTNYGTVDTRTNGASNELNVALGDYTLTSVTAWREFYFHPNNSDGNYGLNQYADNVSGYDVGAKQYSQELRLSSPTGGTVDWTAGIYLLNESIKSDNRQRYGQDAVALQQKDVSSSKLANPAILNGVEADLYGKAGITTIAQFAQATYHYDERTALTFGLRNSYEDRTSSDTGYYWGGAQLPTSLANVRTDYVIQQIGGTNFDLSGEQKTDSISFLINPSYKFTDNITGYINVARGVKSGAANTTAVPLYFANSSYVNKNLVYPVIGAVPTITEPEVSRDYEIGFKSQWLDNRLVVNANVYWNDIYDFQAVLGRNYTFTDSSGNLNIVTKSYLGNIPHIRLAGVELEGRYSPIEHLWINFAGAYNGARYINYPNATPPADYAASYPHAQLNLSGVTIPNVTPFSFALGANYEYAAGSYLGESVKGYVYANEFFKSTTQFSLGPEYTRYVLSQPSYSIVNAGFGFKTEDEKYDISIWAKNLFNKHALTSKSLSSSGTNLALGTLFYVEPLTVGATLRTKL